LLLVAGETLLSSSLCQSYLEGVIFPRKNGQG
jgi:hypothetical protein